MVFAALNLLGVTSEVTLTASLGTGKSACPGESITFMCIVSGSRTLFWSSNEYISTGGIQLEFTTSDRVGKRLNSSVNPDTFAILTNVVNDGKTTLLQSELHIVTNQSSIVSCLTVNSRMSITFNVLSDGMCNEVLVYYFVLELLNLILYCSAYYACISSL